MMTTISTNLKREFVLWMLLMALVGCSSGTNQKQQRHEESEYSAQRENTQLKTDSNKIKEITREYAEKLLKDKENLAGRSFSEIEPQQKPYVQTFFMKTQGTSPDDTLSPFIRQAIYIITSQEESSALYVYTDAKDRIINIKIDEFNGIPSHSYTDSDYVVDIYDRKSDTVFGETKKVEIERYEGKDIDAFEREFGLGRPLIIATDLINRKELYYYRLFTESEGEPSMGVFVSIKEWQIVGIKIDDPNFSFDRLDEYFGNK